MQRRLPGGRVEVVDARELVALIPGHLRGSVLLSSTPTTGDADAPATPADAARPRSASRASACFGVWPSGSARMTTSLPGAELPVEGAQQAAAHAADQLAVDCCAAADELAADERAEAFEQLRERSSEVAA